MDAHLHRFTSDDGLSIAYRQWNAHAAGPPVVLHHGFASDGVLTWELPGVVAALTAAGRHVLAIDARGHGASDKPHDPVHYGEPIMARDLATLVHVAGSTSYDLVGYSMGAVVALLTAAEDLRVRRLVIGGVGAAVVELGGVDTRALSNIVLAEALEAEDPATIADPAGAAFREFAQALRADRLALAAQARSMHASPIALHAVTAPTLLLAGASDPLAVRPEVLARAIARAELRMLNGDHLGALLDPAFGSALCSFLSVEA